MQVSLLGPFCMSTYILYIESHERPSREQSVVSGFYLKDCIKTTLRIYTCVLSISQPFLQIQGLVLNEMFHRKIAICEVVKKEQNCRNFCKNLHIFFLLIYIYKYFYLCINQGVLIRRKILILVENRSTK